MTTTGAFWKQADKFARLGQPRIAFGLNKPDSEIIQSLVQSSKRAHIVIVGPPEIASVSGFELIIDEQPEKRLASLLANEEVDGIVRGTIDDKKTLHAYQDLTGETARICPALMEVSQFRAAPRQGRSGDEIVKKQFFICPVSNTDGWTKEDRFEEARDTGAFVRTWDIVPKIAVYMAMHPETASSDNPAINQARSDADWIVKKLADAEFYAKNVGIDLGAALGDDYNIHVPVNGMVGNQIFRALFFCGGKVLTATRIGFSRPYEDNSRSEKDFEPHIRWLVGYINKKRFSSRGTSDGKAV